MEQESERTAVIAGFRLYLYNVAIEAIDPEVAANSIASQYGLKVSKTWQAKTRSELMNELSRIQALSDRQDISLLCWCAPKKCHCDIIVNYVNYVKSLTAPQAVF